MRLFFTISLSCLFSAASALALPGAEPGAVTRPSEARSGTFLVEGTAGIRAAPNVATEVYIQVTGLIARTHVVQHFLNPTSDWVEGVYVFPLPEGSAVDALEMRVGERILEGQIQKRIEAKRTYEKAKSEGRKATLVEQERPNMFTTTVANLGPGEELEVRLTYQEDVRYDHGRFSLRFPMVVAPRYVRGASTALGEGIDEMGWSANPAAPIPGADAHRIQPPVVDDMSDCLNPVSITLKLDAGFRLKDIRSPSHPVRIEARPDAVYEVALEAETVPADADFVLEWKPVVGDAPSAALFTEEWEGEHYALLMIVPPPPETGEQVRLSRETIFVIDTSGSMSGESIVQARSALDVALAQLQPEDSFNVIRFSSNFSRLYPQSRRADARSVADARAWVSGLQADGGTEMLPALDAALSDDAERSAVRQVIFITDGAIGNEDALFGALRRGLGRSRLYSIGIGSAPNSHFMTKAAELGRGTFTYISKPGDVQEKMGELFAKLDSPVLHDLEVSWDAADVEVWPAQVPDVYLGEPVVIAARMRDRSGGVVVDGRRGAEDVVLELPVSGGSPQSGIARLWARRKVKSLLDSRLDGADAERVAEEVTTLGLRHHLVTRWTSLVAVDITPTAPIDTAVDTREIPSLLPRGWSMSGLFGGTAGQLVAAAAPLPPALQRARVATAQPNAFRTPGSLPQGGTPATLLIGLGGVLLGSSALLRSRGRHS